MTILPSMIVLSPIVALTAVPPSPFVSLRPRLPTITDKTLVAWVRPANLDQRGGSVITLEARDRFDAIVFGELKPSVWMAGSEMFHRTQQDQAAYPQETHTGPGFVRMAAVYRGKRITLFREDAVIADYTIEGDPMVFGSGSQVLIGLRHLARRGQSDAHFAGEIGEVRIYDRALTPGELAALRMGTRRREPKPLARFTFDNGSCRDAEGTFPPGKLHGGAVVRHGSLILNGKDAFMSTEASMDWRNTWHFRPSTGNFADPIPFFWKGEYHVFYLQGDVGPVPWQHIVSKDLIRWKELPTALVSDGAPDSPDGGHMFTGCVMEHAGTFHIFYTGHNPANPRALEVLRHATSRDLIHWTKDPDFEIGPDGIHYAAKRWRNWRDPYVFWNEAERRWWMVVIATDPEHAGGENDFGKAVQGLLLSDDLRTWTQRPHLPGGLGEECPDLFRIGDTWYLIGGGRYVSGPAPGGPFTAPPHNVIDFPGVYAGKRMFDGKRHIWVGWAWDGPGHSDEAVAGHGVLSWGGFMCMPRELYPGGQGELFCRPASEIVAMHATEISKPDPATPNVLPLPSDGMIECVADIEPGADLSLTIREQPDGRAYKLIVRPAKGRITFATPASEWHRDYCRIDASKPISLRVFTDGTIIECFVNDAYAITRRVYDLDGGVARAASSGALKIRTLTLKGMAKPPRKNP
jgi:sucrose-6-phosphate hydrolase SacC (GH32 family)